MSDYSILLVSVVGLAVLMLVQVVFFNAKKMNELALKARTRRIGSRAVSLLFAIIIAEFCFYIMLVIMNLNPNYSFLITVVVFFIGLLVVSVRAR